MILLRKHMGGHQRYFKGISYTLKSQDCFGKRESERHDMHVLALVNDDKYEEKDTVYLTKG